MQFRAHSSNAIKHSDPMHGTLQDVSWDLGSVEHRVGQLETIVKQLKAEVAKLRDELLEVRREGGTARPDSSIPFKNNGHDNGSGMPSAGPADS